MKKVKNKYEIIQFIHQGKTPLREINPDIEKLTIKLDFVNELDGLYETNTIYLSPNDKAICTPDCINNSCTKGYFDLSSKIYFALKEKKPLTYGKLECEGWQDTERIGNHRCGTSLQYEIITDYHK